MWFGSVLSILVSTTDCIIISIYDLKCEVFNEDNYDKESFTLRVVVNCCSALCRLWKQMLISNSNWCHLPYLPLSNLALKNLFGIMSNLIFFGWIVQWLNIYTRTRWHYSVSHAHLFCISGKRFIWHLHHFHFLVCRRSSKRWTNTRHVCSTRR